MKLCGIYKIVSLIKPNRIYIGSAININNRWNRHISDLQLNRHHCRKLQRHVNKYGINDLQFSIILFGCKKEELVFIEQLFLDNYNPYFNECKVAGSCLGHKASTKTRLKLSKLRLGKKIKSGWHHTVETKIKMSISHYGKPGIKCTDKRKKELSEQRKGRSYDWMKYPKTQEHKDKISISLQNKTHTIEHNLHISQSLLGRKRGPYNKKV